MEIFLSSAKKFYGLRELLSENSSLYWSTDDSLPHSITIEFPKKTYVYSIVLTFMFFTDESYTPEKMTVYYESQRSKACFAEESNNVSFNQMINGNIVTNKPHQETFNEVKLLFKEPNGDREILINDVVHKIYVVINSNHSDGKDSRIRKLAVMKSPTEKFHYDESMFNDKKLCEKDDIETF